MNIVADLCPQIEKQFEIRVVIIEVYSHTHTYIYSFLTSRINLSTYMFHIFTLTIFTIVLYIFIGLVKNKYTFIKIVLDKHMDEVEFPSYLEFSLENGCGHTRNQQIPFRNSLFFYPRL